MTFNQWKQLASRVNGIAERISRMKIDRAKAIAIENGIGADACCIHNASIDTNFTGWCAGPNGRERLKAARRAKRLWDDNEHNRIAKRILARAWERVNNS